MTGQEPRGEEDADLLQAAVRALGSLEIDDVLAAGGAGLAALLGGGVVHAYRLAPGAGEAEHRGSWPEGSRAGGRPPSHWDRRVLLELAERPGWEPPAACRLGHPRWPDDAGARLLVAAAGEPDRAEVFFVAVAPHAPGEPSGSAADRARRLARLLEPAVRHALIVGDLRDAAIRDDLARCYNRRHFDDFLNEEVARARRFRTRVALVFFDLDGLKSVNTEHGHPAGSRLLQDVAARVGAGIRGIDKLFRFGGDEFCLILPETDLRGAVEVAERARRSLSREPFLAAETGGTRMSASFGVAAFPDHAADVAALLAAADRAMQSAKRAGKNAVVAAGAEPAAVARPAGAQRRARGPRA